MIAAGADPNIYNDSPRDFAGGRNLAQGLRGFTPANAEQIAAWDPSGILLNRFEAARAKGRERCQGFVEALARRLAAGRMMADEVVADAQAGQGCRSPSVQAAPYTVLPCWAHHDPAPS